VPACPVTRARTRTVLLARAMAQASRSIPGARIVTIPAGHRVHSRRPREFLAAVLPFLAGAQAEGG
jgi:pimeloyl-ACP methyl ester carboxylesterase